MPVFKHSEHITLYKQYTSEEYPKYDNYDAIEVAKVAVAGKSWTGEYAMNLRPFFEPYE